MSRTVETLWSEPLEHNCSWLPQCGKIPVEFRDRYQSIKPIRLVIDNAGYKGKDTKISDDIDKLFKKSDIFQKYQRLIGTFHPWYQPRLRGWWDIFRWDLHLKLLKWGVII